MSQVKENSLVVKSNYLIEASYRLTTQEQRIILVMASMVKPDDADFQLYRINVRDFNELVGVRNEAGYTETKEITKNLLKRVLIIRNIENDSELQIGWLASAQYYHGKGYVELEFSPKLKPYLLELRSRFTSYQLKNVLKLKSSYSIRIYELLKQFEKIRERSFEFEDLKKRLGIPEDKYKQYGHFKDKILNKAKKELKGVTDIAFTFREKKKGRKVTGIIFFIKTRTIEKEAEKELYEELEQIKNIELYTTLQEYYLLSPDQAKDVLSKYRENDILEVLEYVKKQYDNGQIKKLGPYTLKAIQSGWKEQRTFFDVEKEQEAEARRQAEAQKRLRETLEVDYQGFYREQVEKGRESLPEAKIKEIEAEELAKIKEKRPNERFANILLGANVRSRLAEMFNIPSEEDWIETEMKKRQK
ncbi:replication initiation protein [Desulfatibacillum aliphaticivorans]|uniref:replication initiation protein n=1 Tax=Desulfatibacillum aliphaticivorans TaxID=218208 RepID=UPI00040A4237|nr:replication initiation protein [Desulfatibacillum aliphaticivorans]